MADFCPSCGSPLAVYGTGEDRKYRCNRCGWRFGGASNFALPVSAPQFSSLEKPRLHETGTLESVSVEAQPKALMATSQTVRQTQISEIFRGAGADAELKRTIALRYIERNPPQIEVVEWLQTRAMPRPSSWKRYHFDDWTDAWKTRRDLVKRLLSGITGKLRENGYQVGGFWKM